VGLMGMGLGTSAGGVREGGVQLGEEDLVRLSPLDARFQLGLVGAALG